MILRLLPVFLLRCGISTKPGIVADFCRHVRLSHSADGTDILCTLETLLELRTEAEELASDTALNGRCIRFVWRPLGEADSESQAREEFVSR